MSASFTPCLLLLCIHCQVSQRVSGPKSLGPHTEIHSDPFRASRAMGDKP